MILNHPFSWVANRSHLYSSQTLTKALKVVSGRQSTKRECCDGDMDRTIYIWLLSIISSWIISIIVSTWCNPPDLFESVLGCGAGGGVVGFWAGCYCVMWFRLVGLNLDTLSPAVAHVVIKNTGWCYTGFGLGQRSVQGTGWRRGSAIFWGVKPEGIIYVRLDKIILQRSKRYLILSMLTTGHYYQLRYSASFESYIL